MNSASVHVLFCTRCCRDLSSKWSFRVLGEVPEILPQFPNFAASKILFLCRAGCFIFVNSQNHYFGVVIILLYSHLLYTFLYTVSYKVSFTIFISSTSMPCQFIYLHSMLDSFFTVLELYFFYLSSRASLSTFQLYFLKLLYQFLLIYLGTLLLPW